MYTWHNFSLDFQSNMIQLLEIILGDGTDKVVDSLQPASVNSLVDLLPIVSSNSRGIELDDLTKCCLQGILNSSIFLFPYFSGQHLLLILFAFQTISRRGQVLKGREASGSTSTGFSF